MISRLEQIKLSDFQNLGGEVSEWLKTREEIPDYFLKRLKGIDKGTSLEEFLVVIRNELFGIYGAKRAKAKSFSDSRFTPLPKMIERGMTSCGALTNIFGTALRKFGVPVRFVHGVIEGQTEEDRHAWLEIYNPVNKDWLEADPTHPEFELIKEAKMVKVYHDWFELKEDYEKGDF